MTEIDQGGSVRICLRKNKYNSITKQNYAKYADNYKNACHFCITPITSEHETTNFVYGYYYLYLFRMNCHCFWKTNGDVHTIDNTIMFKIFFCDEWEVSANGCSFFLNWVFCDELCYQPYETCHLTWFLTSCNYCCFNF